VDNAAQGVIQGVGHGDGCKVGGAAEAASDRAGCKGGGAVRANSTAGANERREERREISRQKMG